ncbi:chorismate lyase [Thorsellia anophelis]|uniref:Chorismate pyruvate-lyase n=1 Tax=Thorsellia anophelis DSM 18579 TaxID=1123402 RepID=A0A1H9Y8H4_9GAMM|nr:chorismate lyase [Thorsellia anophelis]SES65082.1 chorismate lyase [Thorsellia anophelis DSM 18579]
MSYDEFNITNTDNAILQGKLGAAEFFAASSFEYDESFLLCKSWLLEVGSMTKRFESLGMSVTVYPHVEQFIDLSSNALNLPCGVYPEGRYWQRDITLYANRQPWLIARTLIPEVTLFDNNQKLIDLGTIPLGRYLFSHPGLIRSKLEIARISIELSSLSEQLQSYLVWMASASKRVNLWGRRSHLLINGYPLQLVELFLPHSPLYTLHADK